MQDSESPPNLPQKTGRTKSGRFTSDQISPGRRPGSKNKIPRDIRAMVAESAPEIVAALIKKAKAGHVHSGVGLLRLVVAPLRETADPIEIDIAKISTPSEAAEAMGVVIMAATAGKVSPDAARDVVAMIGALGKQIESTDLERRLSAIESAIKASGQ